jgi:Zn finger protein HypA/HybF involved in hydrogenase expression
MKTLNCERKLKKTVFGYYCPECGNNEDRVFDEWKEKQAEQDGKQ